MPNPPAPAPQSASRLVPIDQFYREHRTGLLFAAAFAFCFNAIMAWHLGWTTMLLIIGAHVAAILYRVPILPPSFPRRRLKDLPASKDLLVAAAWAGRGGAGGVPRLRSWPSPVKGGVPCVGWAGGAPAGPLPAAECGLPERGALS